MRMPLKAFSCCQWCSPWADKDRRSRCGSSSWLQEQSTECKLRRKQESNKRCKSKASCVWPVSGVVGGGQLQESVHSLARTLHGAAACLVACLRVAIAGQMPRKKETFCLLCFIVSRLPPTTSSGDSTAGPRDDRVETAERARLTSP